MIKTEAHPDLPPMERDGILTKIFSGSPVPSGREGAADVAVILPGSPSKYLKDKKLRTEDFKGVRPDITRPGCTMNGIGQFTA